jgi:endonuclease YncB( thermonuclease family)
LAAAAVQVKRTKSNAYLIGYLVIIFSVIKTPNRIRFGVFFSLICFPGLSYSESFEASCRVQGDLQWVQLGSVVDGDTLRLKDGRKIRLIAFNAPELANGDRPAQPFATEAKQAVQHFFQGHNLQEHDLQEHDLQENNVIGLQLGGQSQDHYGRVLAHVFRRDGANLAAHMIERGLASQVVVPPNTRYWQCLQSLETGARRERKGLWAHQQFRIRDAVRLTLRDTGFQRVRGIITSVTAAEGYWWLEMGRMVVRLSVKDLTYFEGIHPTDWLHKRLTVRGWVVSRQRSKAVIDKGFNPYLVSLRHPVMLECAANAQVVDRNGAC